MLELQDISELASVRSGGLWGGIRAETRGGTRPCALQINVVPFKACELHIFAMICMCFAMFFESRPGVICSDLQAANQVCKSAHQKTLNKKHIFIQFASCKSAQITAGRFGGNWRFGGKRRFFLVAWLPNTQPRRKPTPFG